MLSNLLLLSLGSLLSTVMALPHHNPHPNPHHNSSFPPAIGIPGHSGTNHSTLSGVIQDMANHLGPVPSWIYKLPRKMRYGSARSYYSTMAHFANVGMPQYNGPRYRKTMPDNIRRNVPINNPAIAKAAGQVDVCSADVGGYHVVLTQFYIPEIIASLVCAAFGWNYAVVPSDGTWQNAGWALGNCTANYAGIWSLNGYDAEGCSMMQSSGVIVISATEADCQAGVYYQLLCQEGPIEVTATLSTTVAGSTTTTTTTTTTSVAAKIGAVEAKKRNPIDKSAVATRRTKVFGQVIDGYDVCSASYGGLHIVYDYFDFEDAFQVCNDLGWYLADIPDSSFSDLLNLYTDCAPIDVIFSANSFSGLALGLCRGVYFVPWYNVWGIQALNQDVCDFFMVPVVCMESPTYESNTSGPDSLTTIPVTYTTVYATSTETDTATVTTTTS